MSLHNLREISDLTKNTKKNLPHLLIYRQPKKNTHSLSLNTEIAAEKQTIDLQEHKPTWLLKKLFLTIRPFMVHNERQPQVPAGYNGPK